MVKIQIISNNVRGLCEYAKRRNIFYQFHIKKTDIVMLQETHSTKQCESIWNTQWGNKIWFSHGTSAARGTAILIRKGFNCAVHNVIKDEEGRYVILYTVVGAKG